MSLLLNIDTASEKASVSLAENGVMLSSAINNISKDHASFVHPAIKQLLSEAGKNITEIDAVAVTEGPGSYTGIRVGMSSAKGLCTALNIPLILINSLELLAQDIKLHYPVSDNDLLIPMIDARRMEVFTAVYELNFNELLKPSAIVLDDNSYHEFDANHRLLFFGSGINKFQGVVKLRNCIFISNVNLPLTCCKISHSKYELKAFTDLIYSEPFYLKEFYNPH